MAMQVQSLTTLNWDLLKALAQAARVSLAGASRKDDMGKRLSPLAVGVDRPAPRRPRLALGALHREVSGGASLLWVRFSRAAWTLRALDAPRDPATEPPLHP